MRRGLRSTAAVLIAFGLGATTPAFGQTGSSGNPTVLEEWLLSAPERTTFIAVVSSKLRRHDVAQDGLDAQDIETVEMTQAAAERSHRVQQLLLYDLDGDGSVTREEVRRVIRGQNAPRSRDAQNLSAENRIDKKVDEAMKADRDGDGTITPEEMRAPHPERARRSQSRIADELKVLLALDPNKDGRITTEELTALAEETFRRYDTNGNGFVSADEMAAVRQVRKAERELRKAKEICDLPAPAPDEQVIVLGIYEGKSLSTVTVAGMDQETTTGTIEIEPGPAPLYVIVASHDPMIWQFRGATGRIARLVAIPVRATNGPGVGVAGIDPKKVTFLKAGACNADFHDVISPKAQKAHATIEQSLGRSTAIFAGLYGLETVNLPSAETVPTPKSAGAAPQDADPAMLQELLRFYPGGLTDFDPAKVVAPGPVIRYDVLPQQAGLLQLIKDASIVPLSTGGFRIVKPIVRFPAGLYGAHSVDFLLAKGVPMPGGKPGHGCVFSEEDGRILVGSANCLSTNRSTAFAAGRKGPAKGLHPVLEHTLLNVRSHSRYMAVVLDIFRKYDRNQDGLDAEDIEAVEAPAQVRMRADRMKVTLAFDVNGDGQVTRDEVERRTRLDMGLPPDGTIEPRKAAGMAQRVARIMGADANRDGIITYEELQLPLERDRKSSRDRNTFQARSLLDADPNKDGRLTVDEVTNLAEETFRRHDTDGNNELSKEEINALLRATQGGTSR